MDSNELLERIVGLTELATELNNKAEALEKRNKELVVELMQRSAQVSEAKEEVIRLKKELEDLSDLLRITTVDRSYDETEEFLLRSNNESRRLRMLIEIHKDQTGHNLCWMNDLRLWREAFNDPTIEYPHRTIPSEEEFVEIGCEAYCRPYFSSRFKPVLPPAGSMPRLPNS